MARPSASSADLAREVAAACQLFADAAPDDQASANQLLVERATELLESLGYRVRPSYVEGQRARGSQPAFRVESVVDYVIRDGRWAAGLVRARAEQQGTGLCTPEPLEQDPLGILLDLLELDLRRFELTGVVEVLRYEQVARSLTASERRETEQGGVEWQGHR